MGSGLTFRKAAIGQLIMLVLMAGGFFLLSEYRHIWIGILILSLFVFLGLIVYGSAVIRSEFFMPVIWRGQSSRKEIAITFDDGPDPSITPEVLDILKSHQAPATFFCIGNRIEGNEHILKRMEKEGHHIANHSWTHSYVFDFFGARRIRNELSQTAKRIEAVIGKYPRFFRPPYGVTTPEIGKAVKALDLEVIGWSVRSLDTVIKDENKLIEKVTKNLKPGDIVLFHDVHPRIGSALKKFLEYIDSHQFRVVPLERLINQTPYEITDPSQ